MTIIIILSGCVKVKITSKQRIYLYNRGVMSYISLGRVVYYLIFWSLVELRLIFLCTFLKVLIFSGLGCGKTIMIPYKILNYLDDINSYS